MHTLIYIIIYRPVGQCVYLCCIKQQLVKTITTYIPCSVVVFSFPSGYLASSYRELLKLRVQEPIVAVFSTCRDIFCECIDKSSSLSSLAPAQNKNMAHNHIQLSKHTQWNVHNIHQTVWYIRPETDFLFFTHL